MNEPEFLAAFFVVLGVLSLIGIFVRRALLKPLRAALGDSYRKDRTYAGVFEAIALDEDELQDEELDDGEVVAAAPVREEEDEEEDEDDDD